MKIKKWSSVIAVSVIVVSALACRFGARAAPAGDNPASAPSQPPAGAPGGSASSLSGACANPYSPIVAGATWNYQLTGTAPDTFVHSILAVDAAGFTEQDVFGSGVTQQGQWKCDNGNLIALSPIGGATADFKTTALDGITFPASLTPGVTWSQSITIEGLQDVNGTEVPVKKQFSAACTAVGIESVSAPAGTFDAMRADCKTTVTITVTFNNFEIPTTLNMNGTNWYAPAVGLIKAVKTSEDMESTVELVSYNIP